MSYDNDFYKAYAEYLREPSVRQAHDWVFQIAAVTSPVFKGFVFDYGCGQSQEYLNHAKPNHYIGIDVSVENSTAYWAGRWLVKGDYRTFSLKESGHELFHSHYKPKAFVSLFSIECTAPAIENYKFYEKIFDDHPFDVGLVSGFYYASKKDMPVIGETGGIQSFQTLEDIDTVSSLVFSEKRIILPVPSAMFGSDVFEVWKILERR